MHRPRHWWWVVACFIVVGLAHSGCKKPSSSPLEEKAGEPRQGQTLSAPALISPSPPEARCLRSENWDKAASVVCVQGYPLVFTGQAFPEAANGGALPEDLDAQLKLAWDHLVRIVQEAGSEKEKIVRIGVSIAQQDDATHTIDFIRQQFSDDWLPSITAVITPLPREKARVAFDAVAYSEEPTSDVKPVRLTNDSNAASDAAVCPPGGLVFFSGLPDKSPLPKAVENAVKALLETAKGLHVEKKDILQVRVFLQPMGEMPAVLEELKRAFPDGTMPPVILTEWIASAPVEIEMVARLPSQAVLGSDVVRFYNPPGVKPSPTFSKVAIVQTDRFVFFPSFLSRKDGSGQEQVNDVFDQLTEGLKLAGSDLRHLVKGTYYVVDKEASDAIDAVRKERYDPERPPAASKVTIHGVGRAGRTVGVDMIAVPVASPK